MTASPPLYARPIRDAPNPIAPGMCAVLALPRLIYEDRRSSQALEPFAHPGAAPNSKDGKLCARLRPRQHCAVLSLAAGARRTFCAEGAADLDLRRLPLRQLGPACRSGR